MDFITGLFSCWQFSRSVNSAVDQAKDSLVENDEEKQEENGWLENVQDRVDAVVDAPKNWAEERRKKKYEKQRQQYNEHKDNLRAKYNLDERKKKKQKKGWW